MMHETGPNLIQRVHPQEEITFRLLCSNDKVGGIIGKDGIIIQALPCFTGVDIKIVDSVPEEDERVVIISASAVRHLVTTDHCGWCIMLIPILVDLSVT
jgi:predicted RNA-binding protein YlqC (UPF0109 family)